MSTATTDRPAFVRAGRSISELPLLACWLNVVAASMAQAATIPGRVHGLMLITEPLMASFGISRTLFGTLNLAATAITAVLALWYGTIIQRAGVRRTYLVLAVALGLATAMLSIVNGTWLLLLAIVLARVMGQGVFALVSTSMVGMSFPRRVPLVMATYSVMTAILYTGLVQFIKWGTSTKDGGGHLTWQEVWIILGSVMILALVPFGFFAVSDPRVGLKTGKSKDADDGDASPLPLASLPPGRAPERTLREAMATPVFLLMGLSCLVGGTAGAGITLFNESLLKDRGFSREVFFDSVTIGIVGAVLFKFLAAWLCERWSMGKMNALSTLASGGAVIAIPFLETVNQVYLWSMVKALAMSAHIVIYFSIWSYAFGRKDLPQIQGAAHVLTITASGLGPPLFGWWRDSFHSYDTLLYVFGAGSLLIGLAMWFVPVACAERPREEQP